MRRACVAHLQHAFSGDQRKDHHLIAAAQKPYGAEGVYDNIKAMLPRAAPTIRKPQWHAPWKLYRWVHAETEDVVVVVQSDQRPFGLGAVRRRRAEQSVVRDRRCRSYYQGTSAHALS